ncbi:MAG: MBL fold metallo-hydrolase [Bacillota bacterium]
MKKAILFIISICMICLFAGCGGSSDVQENSDQAEQTEPTEQETQMDTKKAKLLYMGHASIRITTVEDKVIYIDPFVGDGYEPAADLILVTHDHYDHTVMDKVKNRNEGCQVITWEDALANGKHQNFDLGYAKIESVEAGYNKNHDVRKCVGYIITLSDGVKVYVTGDTSMTEEMSVLDDKKIDYAFFCCDGVYNMDRKEASKCAAQVKAKHSIPYHMTAADTGVFFDQAVAEEFQADNRLIIADGEEIELEK